MIRKAHIMYLDVKKIAEYKQRHDHIWPEMIETLKTHGVHNYSIFLDEETGRLFAYVEIEDEQIWGNISKTEVCQRWWDYMAPLMKTNPDHSPVSDELKPMFYLA
ncbi:L-rhamnose mutarotase [Bacillus sp. NPDC077027]|uniref:L-rhamnose mutarotase n=1 Tax=Bacillus sp. NPDC077027 TaxID=3390548 RepID=UPI003D02FF6A